MGQTTVARVLGGYLLWRVPCRLGADGLSVRTVGSGPRAEDYMSIRAGYEQRHRDCLDVRFHLDAVLAARP